MPPLVNSTMLRFMQSAEDKSDAGNWVTPEARLVNSRGHRTTGSSWVAAATQQHQMLFGSVGPELSDTSIFKKHKVWIFMWNLQNFLFCHFILIFSKSQHLYFILSSPEVPPKAYTRKKICGQWGISFSLHHKQLGFCFCFFLKTRSSQDRLSNRNLVTLT